MHQTVYFCELMALKIQIFKKISLKTIVGCQNWYLLEERRELKMSKIITIANSKGGVGKTTTSIYLATLLSEYGSVLLKDSDPQGSATEWVEDIEEMPFDFELTNQRQMGKTKGYDYVVIDTPPQNSDIIRTAIEVADILIIPTEPSGIELSRVFSLVDSSQKDIKKKVLLTKVLSNTNSFKYTKALLDEENIDYFNTYISRREGIKNSFGKIPSSKNEVTDYIELVEEIRGELDE